MQQAFSFGINDKLSHGSMGLQSINNRTQLQQQQPLKVRQKNKFQKKAATQTKQKKN